jgi:hypothetical protein
MKIKTTTSVFMVFLLLMAGSAFALEIIKHSSGSAEVTITPGDVNNWNRPNAVVRVLRW